MGGTNGLCEKPFVGLRPFEPGESILFFGRQRQVVELLGHLHETRLVAVVGSSGSGKSSLVRAGLIPALRGGFLVGDRDRWIVCVATPGDSPVRRLATEVAAALEPLGLDADAASLRKVFESSGVSGLVKTISPLLDAAGANLVVVIDQFEEIFRRDEEPGSVLAEEDADYVSVMLGLARQRAAPVFVALTMRSDHLGDCDVFPGLPEALNESQFLVPRLSRDEVQVAIEGPVRLFKRSVAPRLVDRLLNDSASQRDQLPLLQHVLLRMWDLLIEGGQHTIDLEHYEDRRVGTLLNALNRHAEEALEGLDEAALRKCRSVFQALTATDYALRRVRRWQRRRELTELTGLDPAALNRLLDRFRVAGRSFLRYSGDPRDPETLVDISHESLIRQWTRLSEWVDEEARNREAYVEIRDAAARWQAGAGSLWRDPELEQARRWWAAVRPTPGWAKRYGGQFETTEQFLKASEQQQAREIEEEKERQALKVRTAVMRRALLVTSIAAAVAITTAVAAATAAATAWYQWQRAQSATHVARSAVALKNHDPEGGLREAVLAMEKWGTTAAEGALRAALAETVVRRRWELALPLASTAAFSPDGRRIMAATASGAVAGRGGIWDLEAGRLESTVCGVDVASARWTPDGERLILGLSDGRVLVWEPGLSPADPERLPALVEEADAAILDLDLRADARELALVDAAGGLRRFDVSTESPVRAVEKPPLGGIVSPEYPVWSVAYSPDGSRLAIGDSLGRMSLVAADSGRLICRTAPRGVDALRVVFSGPSLGLVGASTFDYTVTSWPYDRCESPVATFFGHGGAVLDLAFTPDGDYLVTVSDDGSMRLWDPGSGEELFAREVPGVQLSRVSVSGAGGGGSNGTRDRVLLLTVGSRRDDPTRGFLTLWDVAPRAERDEIARLTTERVTSSAGPSLLERARQLELPPGGDGVEAPDCP